MCNNSGRPASMRGGLFSCLHFYYDASNKPAIVEFNGTKYAYVHNLQGDIVAILNSAGTAVVNYVYDASNSSLVLVFRGINLFLLCSVGTVGLIFLLFRFLFS